MNTKPILFSTPMVQAILEGRKTMTRRSVKKQPVVNGVQVDAKPLLKGNGLILHFEQIGGVNVKFAEVHNPYGQIGDILWVREAWRLRGWQFDQKLMTIEYRDGKSLVCPEYKPEGNAMWLLDQVEALEAKGYIEQSPTEKRAFVFTDKPQPFKPSIHMPKEAARIWLKITDVKVERLHDISDNNILAEGLRVVTNKDGSIATGAYFNGKCTVPRLLKGLWSELWISINGIISWAANPWVWVISFEVLSTTGKPENLQS